MSNGACVFNTPLPIENPTTMLVGSHGMMIISPNC